MRNKIGITRKKMKRSVLVGRKMLLRQFLRIDQNWGLYRLLYRYLMPRDEYFLAI